MPYLRRFDESTRPRPRRFHCATPLLDPLERGHHDKDPSNDDGEVNLADTFEGFGLNLLFPYQNQNWGKLTISGFPQNN